MADTTVNKLERMLAELRDHKKRLEARVKALRAAAKAEPDQAKRELMALGAEAIDELVETGLDFQVDLTATVLEAMASMVPDTDDGGDGGDGDVVEVGLEPEDADQILKVLATHREMLEAYIEQSRSATGIAPSQLAELERRQKDCLEVVELVEGLVLVEGDGAEDEAEDDDDETEPGAEAEPDAAPKAPAT
jgi:hypothetical protein